MPFENGILSEILLENGYTTFRIGKWHLNPSEEGTPAVPSPRVRESEEVGDLPSQR
jgi:arylsulfatase A-like enzyme